MPDRNRLANESSPYLRQHADNPVDWYPWGDEAFATARERDVPILLSVGYSACHWCHVMAHESFEDVATAAEMNRRFVNIKVDREERPDVDAVYMEATQAMTGSGGWPMTVFMTPDAAPFFCGTYFPPERRGGHPAFGEILDAVSDAWTSRREDLLDQASRLVDGLSRDVTGGVDGDLPSIALLDEATMSMMAVHDPRWGGFGQAPKFPQAMALRHLVRHAARTGSAAVTAAVVTSLDAMASGGMYDQIGGGFSRYSVDERWLVPHFEKMLYDNALLLRLYAHAAQVTGLDRYRQVVTETVDYVLRDLSHPDGGRYSAEDADSLASDDATHAHEGAFYVWTPEQVADVLDGVGLGQHSAAVCDFYGIAAGGNFEGASVPNRLHARGDFERPVEIDAARRAMLDVRANRPRPGLDDKVLTEWNALFVAALAEAGTSTGRGDWVIEAERSADFLLSHLRRDDGRWLRSWQTGSGARHLAYASDYGALLDAFVALHGATGRSRWLDEAQRIAEDIVELFWDPSGGVFSTGDDAEGLITRPKELMDNATPAGSSTAATGLLRLEALTGEQRYGEHARTLLRAVTPLLGRHALAFGELLWAAEMQAVGMTEIVVSGDRPDLVAAIHGRFLPTSVLAWGERFDGPLWEDRSETGENGRAYVCRNFTCAAPASTSAELEERLNRAS